MRSRRHAYVLMALVAPTLIAAILAALVAIDQLLPYEPYHVTGVEAIPEEVCTTEGVSVRMERSIADGYGVKRAVFDYAWTDSPPGEDEPVVLEYSTTREVVGISPSEPQRITVEGAIPAPPEEGRYWLYVEVTVYGQKFLLPDRQELYAFSDDPIRVRQCNTQEGRR